VEKKKEPTEVSFVDGRRSLNINIFLKQFRKPNEVIIKALKEGDKEILSIEKLQNMIKFAPEKMELEGIASYTGDPARLANVDRYFKLLSELPNYTLRIKAMIAKENFEEEMGTLRPALNDIVKACKVD